MPRKPLAASQRRNARRRRRADRVPRRLLRALLHHHERQLLALRPPLLDHGDGRRPDPVLGRLALYRERPRNGALVLDGAPIGREDRDKILSGNAKRLLRIGERVEGDRFRPAYYYNIRHAESDDGVIWRRDSRTCVDYADETEYAFARPYVTRDADRFGMGTPSGASATRSDMPSRSTESNGRARTMWPVSIRLATDRNSTWSNTRRVLDASGRRFMLHNGNDYGRAGVGLAVWDAD